MKREEKTSILAALENAVNRCNELAEKADTFDEKQYQWDRPMDITMPQPS